MTAQEADLIADLRSRLNHAEQMERLELRDGDIHGATYWHKTAADHRERLTRLGVDVYVSDEE